MDMANEKNSRKNNHNSVKMPPKDPELEAEILYAKENGVEPPRVLPSDVNKKIAEALEEHVIDKNLIKNLKNGRAERKARSRGVSGCSIKKDGNRFEYGLDCIDMAYDDEKFSNKSESDTNDEFDEYADYVCKYSDEEIRQIVGDYLENGNKQETLDSLEKFIMTSDTVSRMINDLIIVVLESNVAGFILGADLLDTMIDNKWVNLQALIDVVEDLVTSVDELAKDVPKAAESLAIFIAKLVDLNIINCNVLSLLATKHVDKGDSVRQCYTDAMTFANDRHLLSGKCAPSGGHQSLDVLSSQFKLILKEYLQSNDKPTAGQRLKELKVPHFNHEFVYQACLFALEQMHDHVMGNLADLLKDMTDKGILAESCITKGFTRLYNELADLYLDLPAAYALALRWVAKSYKAGFISKDLSDGCPTGTLRSRSRTLSEGPDGKLSCMDEDQQDVKANDLEINGHK